MATKPTLPRIIRAPGPKSIPALKKKGYKQAGPKYGPSTFVLPKSAAAAKPAAPAAPVSPYEQQYGATAPWAIPLLQQLDTDQAQHQQYVSQDVMPWLSQGLAALTGVDPSAPGYNPTIQQQYLSNIQGPVGNALNAAAAAQPAAVASTTPGGVTAAPNAYLGTAMGQYAAQRGGASIMEAQAQSALNTVQANTYAQGALRTMADYAAGLPATYVQKRNDLRSKIDQWVAEQELSKTKLAEEMRHNRVQEATSATNAETNAAIAFGNLGLKAEDQAVDNAPDMGPVPAGYVALPDGRYASDPSYVPPAGAKGSGSSTKYTRNWFLEKGWKKVPATAGPKTKASAIKSADGSGMWLKPATGSAAAKKVKAPSVLGQDLAKLYLGDDLDGYGGWQNEFDGRPKEAGAQVVRYVLDNKASFMGANRAVNVRALQQVLGRIPDTAVRDNVLDILDRGYIKNNVWRAT